MSHELTSSHQPPVAGVFTAVVKLPVIDLYGHRMAGTPAVDYAFINGVNSTIAAQYLKTPLDEIKIPRLISASNGSDAFFSLHVDESGAVAGMLPERERSWLVRRATVGHPENGKLSEFEKYRAGIKLLLAELKAEKLGKLPQGSGIS